MHKLSFKLLGQVIRSEPRVLLVRTAQLVSHRWMRSRKFWEKLERNNRIFWDENKTREWLTAVSQGKYLIGKSSNEAFIRWVGENPDWASKIQLKAEDIYQGRFNFFDQPFEFDISEMPWHTDWRFGYTWDNQAYEHYHYYEVGKKDPYDVKYPWELSRFAFFLTLAQAAVMNDDLRWQDLIYKFLTDWEDKNPLAFSVNWQAMICSIRGISFVLTALILATCEKNDPELLTALLRQVTLQGEFIYRNLEYSNARGNHYASNLAGLLLIGIAIQDIYKPAVRWVRYASDRICSEIERQYLPDGVHFEKTTSYHRLVTEFFLLSLLVMEKAGYKISEPARRRIHQACFYIQCYTKPDGFSSNWGDNDGAWLLAFDPKNLRDHRSLLALASAYFEENSFKRAAHEPSASIPWLLGMDGIRKWDELKASTPIHASVFFENAGMVVSRSNGNFFIADFGEVGKRGLGGHGHNDLFSYELVLDGTPIIVDSGSPVYTGDIDLAVKYSSTAYHNTLMIDDEEIAKILGIWRISNEATPRNVDFCSNGEVDIIQGEHNGYLRLKDPVVHKRRFSFNKHKGHLAWRDYIECKGRHSVKIFFHFSPGLSVELFSNHSLIHLSDNRFVKLEWAAGAARAWIEKTQVSETFGSLDNSEKLVVQSEIFGKTELTFDIRLLHPQSGVNMESGT
jgi:uncharacterized heparinase superfamily protein